MTGKEKRLKKLNKKLSFYESKFYRHLSDYEEELTESVSSKINYQEAMMLNVTIEDIRREIEELESSI